MNRETIEKEGRNIALSDLSLVGLNERAIALKYFAKGADWRINSVWHDGTASCETRRKALVLFKNGNAAVYKDLCDLSFERLWGEVDKFAYLDDLLPDGKEETK